MKKKFRGSTLVEVIIAMVIITVVATAAYAGTSAASNFMNHGADIRNDAYDAEKTLENKISGGTDREYINNIHYKVTILNKEGNPEGSVTEYNTDAYRYSADGKNGLVKFVYYTQ